MGKGGSWQFQKVQKIKRFRRKLPYNMPRAGAADFTTLRNEMIKGGRTPDVNPPKVEFKGTSLGDVMAEKEEVFYNPTEPDIANLFDRESKPRNLPQVVQNGRLQGVAIWRPLTVAEDKRMRLIILVSRNDHIFVRVCKITSTYKRSFLYETRGEALGAYNNGRIQWRRDVYVFPQSV